MEGMMNFFPLEEVSWKVSSHARRRILERHGKPFDPKFFTPTEIGNCGLRLWVSENGGVLVRENIGSGWKEFTVVSALSSHQVQVNQKAGKYQPISKLRVPSPPNPEFKKTLNKESILRVHDYLCKTSCGKKTYELCSILKMPDSEVGDILYFLKSMGAVSKTSRRGVWKPLVSTVRVKSLMKESE